MFGLWYLSLAINEIRKHFGWTSIFDVFKTNKTASVKAIENNGTASNTLNKNDVSTSKVQPQVNKDDSIKKTPVTVPPKPEAPQNVLPNITKPQKIAEPVPQKDDERDDSKNPSVTIPSKPNHEATPPSPKISDFKLPERKQPELPKAPIAKPQEPKPEEYKKFTPKEPEVSTLPSQPQPSDTRMFGSFPPATNGFDAPKTKANLRDATSSFLQEEGKVGTPMQKIDIRNKSDTMVDAAVLKKLEDGFAKLAASDSKSLLKKYLTKEVFDNLKNKKTPTFGSTLLDCVQSGFENHDSGVGIYAPDAEAYSVFAELFDPIIEDYHTGFKKSDKHPARDFGDVSVFKNLDPNNEFVVSTRVRCGRSLEGYPFNPCLSEAQYKEMEEKVSSTLSGLSGELKGKFYPLTGMDKAVQQQLIDDHFLFKEGDRFLQSANACRYWPTGRGIYHNDNKTFLVWCNEEDHLRIISMQMGGDLGQVYTRLVNAVNDIEKRLPFSHHDRLGFLTFCPTNLGTTIRASVHIKVPKLAANKAKLEEVAAKYHLQVRGTRGEHTEAEGGVYDISNKRRMGLTEFQAVKEMYDGINELIKLEKSM